MVGNDKENDSIRSYGRKEGCSQKVDFHVKRQVAREEGPAVISAPLRGRWRFTLAPLSIIAAFVTKCSWTMKIDNSVVHARSKSLPFPSRILPSPQSHYHQYYWFGIYLERRNILGERSAQWCCFVALFCVSVKLNGHFAVFDLRALCRSPADPANKCRVVRAAPCKHENGSHGNFIFRNVRRKLPQETFIWRLSTPTPCPPSQSEKLVQWHR